MSRPLHEGPIFSLALMAMFALMIPMVSMINRAEAVKNANAMRVTIPTNEPNYEAGSLPFPSGSPTPTNSPKPSSNPKNQGSMYR